MDIRDLYRMTQDELYDYILDFVQTHADNGFEVLLDAKDEMFIVLLPKLQNDFYPVLISHLDTCISDIGRGLIGNDIVPNSIDVVSIDGKNYYMGKRDGENFILGADDRNGVWTMLTLIERGFHEWGYIFTCDEEPRLNDNTYTCLAGAQALAESSMVWNHPLAEKIGYFVQLDMPYTNILGYHDSYGYGRLTNGNEEFSRLLDEYDPAFGQMQLSVTDISVLCGAIGICGTNLSVGYYNWHTCAERSDIAYVDSLPDRVWHLIHHLGNRQFRIEAESQVDWA